jgi:hypothetical protein
MKNLKYKEDFETFDTFISNITIINELTKECDIAKCQIYK